MDIMSILIFITAFYITWLVIKVLSLLIDDLKLLVAYKKTKSTMCRLSPGNSTLLTGRSFYLKQV